MGEYLELALTAFSTLVIGGGISTIITLRFVKRQAAATTISEEEKAKQEVEHTNQEKHSTDSAVIDNVKDIIEMYKQGFEDIKKLNEEREKALMEKINQLQNQIKLQGEANEEQKKLIGQLQLQVDELTALNDSLKIKVEFLEKSANKHCETCNLRDKCICPYIPAESKKSKSIK